MATCKFILIMVICLVVIMGLVIIHIKAKREAQRTIDLKYPLLPLWKIRFKTSDNKEPNEYSTQIVGIKKEDAIKKLVDNSEFANDKEFKILTVELVTTSTLKGKRKS